MSHAEPTPAFEFDCPLCGGAFEADLAMLGQEVECPHCGRVVELPAGGELEPGGAATGPVDVQQPAAQPSEPPRQPRQEPEPERASGASQPSTDAPQKKQAAASAAPPAPQSQAKEAAPPKETPQPRAALSREERAAARRRMNLALAAVGAVILIVTFVLLVNLS